MNRGSPVALQSQVSATLYFNEAPIHESGKWCRRRKCACISDHFNEAPIHESGKFG